MVLTNYLANRFFAVAPKGAPIVLKRLVVRLGSMADALVKRQGANARKDATIPLAL
jgi:hypothetical protein